MSIAERIRVVLTEVAETHRIHDVRIGLGYTGVMLDNGATGIAYTFRDQVPPGCSVFRGMLPLRGRCAAELLRLLGDNDRIKCSVGLATANALIPVEKESYSTGDILQELHIRQNDTVGMIGYFEPVAAAFRSRNIKLVIFEEYMERGENLLHAQEESARLPECSVVIITGTSIINNSIDSVLSHLSNSRETALLGASTPLLPKAFRNTPVTLLSGVSITDGESMLRTLSEGGGTPDFKPYVRKINMRVSCE